MRPEFKTYWLVDGVRVNSYETMEKLVCKGAAAIEVSAEQQRAAAEERRRRERENAILDEKIRRAAAQRAYERSPEGQMEAAMLTAFQQPGGVITLARTNSELDAYLPDNTNVLR